MSTSAPGTTSQATPRDPMSCLMQPRSIAVIGASADAEKFSGRPLAYLARLGYAGAVYPIHPEAERIAGYVCYRSIAAVPHAVDVAIIARPAASVPDELALCLAHGIRAFVVFSGGFAEAGPEGAALQERLVTLCRAAGAVMCGPNGTGLVNLAERAALSFMSNLDREVVAGGSVAFISGSGSIAAMVTQGRGHVFHTVASIGNEAVSSGADFMVHALANPAISGVVSFLEAIRDPARLVDVARTATLQNKPVALLKAGRTSRSAEVAATHTGAMIDDDRTIDAVLEHHNVIRAASLEELKTLAVLMHAAARRRIGPRVGVVTPSGGTAVLIVDEVLQRGMQMPALEASTCATLLQLIPQSSPGNPMDITGFGAASPALFTQATLAVAADPNIDVVLIPTGGGVGKVGELRARAMIDVAAGTDKLIVPIWQGTTRDQAGYDALIAAGLPVVTDYQIVCVALGQLVRQRQRAAALAARHGAVADPAAALPAAAQTMVDDLLRSTPAAAPAALNEPEVKRLLAACGLAIPKGCAMTAAPAAGAVLPSFPAVLKVVSRAITHKSAAGGVAIVDRAADLAAAIAAMRVDLSHALPDAPIEGFLLEEMARGGLELMVGLKRDARFGTLITLAMGGTWANALRGSVAALLPLTPDAVDELLDRFFGDLNDALVRALLSAALLRLAALGTALGARLDVLEINPLRLVGQGASARLIALDGVLTLQPAPAPAVTA